MLLRPCCRRHFLRRHDIVAAYLLSPADFAADAAVLHAAAIHNNGITLMMPRYADYVSSLFD